MDNLFSFDAHSSRAMSEPADVVSNVKCIVQVYLMPLRVLLSKIKYSGDCQNCDVDLSINSAPWKHMFPARRKTIKNHSFSIEKNGETHRREERAEDRDAQKENVPKRKSAEKKEF